MVAAISECFALYAELKEGQAVRNRRLSVRFAEASAAGIVVLALSVALYRIWYLPLEDG